MHLLTVHRPGGEIREIEFEKETLLSELLQGIPEAPDLVCGGAGVCGKCRVIARGALRPVPADGECLACQTVAEGDAEVFLKNTQGGICAISESGYRPDAKLMPSFEGKYGVAVDIGTTTVALQLFDLETGEALGSRSVQNPQCAVAADVIGRIQASLDGKGKVQKTLIEDCIRSLTESACLSAGISTDDVSTFVIAGNTTMLYLLTERSPETLARAPFKADCLFDIKDGNVYYPPCMDAFVGADITCAVLASEMTERDETSLLIDLGTNGEMALWHDGKLICTSTAAGPAFEGGGISCGSAAVAGAVETVRVEDGELRVSTIGGAKAQSICGSGLIDAVAAFLELEYIDETGAADEDTMPVADDVSLTQKDIRQVQLAKGAIAAGAQTLLKHAGVTLSDVKRLYIAGGFGQHLPIDSAVKIGLIPELPTTVLGNASLSGAALMLLNRDWLEKGRRIAGNAVCHNLSSDPFFSDAFIENMMFE